VINYTAKYALVGYVIAKVGLFRSRTELRLKNEKRTLNSMWVGEGNQKVAVGCALSVFLRVIGDYMRIAGLS